MGSRAKEERGNITQQHNEASEAMDTEAPDVNEELEKHDITSYISPNATMETSEESGGSGDDRPHLGQNAPRMVRSADHLNIAQKKQVEGTQSHPVIQAKHIVKIFTGDDDFIEGEICSECLPDA